MNSIDERDFAYKIKHALTEQADNIPASTAEKLASARKVALSRKKAPTTVQLRAPKTVLAGGLGGYVGERLMWVGRLGTAVPLLVGALLFVGLYEFEQQQRISETAEIDVAVLSDDLPLSAYLDRGFQAYLTKQGE